MKQRKAYPIFKILLALALLAATFSAPISCNIFGEYNNPKDPKNNGGAYYYSVSYNANGATSGTVPVDSNNYAAGATVTVLGNTGGLAKTGYTFAGWNTKADGTGTSYAAGSIFTMGSANVTLYARWTSGNLAKQVGSVTALNTGTYLGITHYPSNAIDEDLNTDWAGTSIPTWIKVAFDKTYSISRIRVINVYHTTTYSIQYSGDGIGWTTLCTHSTPNNKPSGEAEDPDDFNYYGSISGVKYIMVYFTNSDAPSSHIFKAMVSEIQVFQ